MAKKLKPQKLERYQGIGFRPSKRLVVTLAILISVGLIGSVLASALFSLPNAFGPNVATGLEAQIDSYRDALKENPDDIDTRIVLGHALFDQANALSGQQKEEDAQKYYQEAETEYKKVLAKRPEDPQVAGNLAIVYFYTNRPDEAIATAQQSLEKNPDFHTTRLNLGIFYGFGKQNYVAAIQELDKIPNTFNDYARAQDFKKQFNAELSKNQQSPISPGAQKPK